MVDFRDILSVDPRQVLRERDRLKQEIFGAGAAAIREGTRELERELEALVRGVAGGRLWRAISSKVYPGRGPAVSPAGIIYLKGRARTHGAIEYFTTSGRIAPRKSRFLAVPLPAAGGRGFRRGRSWIDNTPEEWERRTGRKLRLVVRRGKVPLLVLDEGVLNKRGIARSNTERRRVTGMRNTTIPIFALLPDQGFTARASMEPRVRAAQTRLPGRVARRINAID